MKAIVKYGLIAVGGYLAYSWYKKSKKTADSKDLNAGVDIDSATEPPLVEQTDEEIRGDGLTTEEKEQYIIANGDISVLDPSDETFFNADANTDDTIMEAAMAEEEGEEGFGVVASELKAKDLLEDSKCGFKALKSQFGDSEYDKIEKDHIDSLFVLVKCRQAQRKGELGCEDLPVVKEAAKKRRTASARLKAKNPTAVRAIMRRCLREGKEKRAKRNPFVVRAKNQQPTSQKAKLAGMRYRNADGVDIHNIHNIHYRTGRMQK
jgi:hypothetical protein